MTDSGLSIAEAARVLAYSESKIRRMIGPGGCLTTIDGSHPVRVTRASVQRERARLLETLGVTESQAELGALRAEVERLTEENERLRGSAENLRQAQLLLLDGLRDWIQPGIPND
jgi:uncharacterized small protein (DUF1192 family)